MNLKAEIFVKTFIRFCGVALIALVIAHAEGATWDIKVTVIIHLTQSRGTLPRHVECHRIQLLPHRYLVGRRHGSTRNVGNLSPAFSADPLGLDERIHMPVIRGDHGGDCRPSCGRAGKG